MKIHPAIVAAIGLSLAGCISSGGADAIKPIASDLSQSGRVDAVVLSAMPTGTDPAFKDVFTSAVRAKLDACAKGTHPLRLVVTVDDFHGSNGFKTWMIGDSNHVRGSAKLVDIATGDVVADYDINRSVGGGGLIAAVAMGNPDQQMGEAFGDEVCKQAFIRR